MTSPSPATDGARDLRHDYLVALDEWEVAARQMRRAIDDSSAALSVLRRHVEDGGSIGEVPTIVAAQPLRSEMSSAIDQLERSRHAAQRVLFTLLVEDGMSMADVGRVFGISRSLVSRLVHEDS